MAAMRSPITNSYSGLSRLKFGASGLSRVLISYNPGQNSFEHLLTNDGNRTNSQDCHRKTSSPLSPPDQCWFEKWNANLTWCEWSSTLIWGRGWISIYNNKFDVRINSTPVVPMILARIVGCACWLDRLRARLINNKYHAFRPHFSFPHFLNVYSGPSRARTGPGS